MGGVEDGIVLGIAADADEGLNTSEGRYIVEEGIGEEIGVGKIAGVIGEGGQFDAEGDEAGEDFVAGRDGAGDGVLGVGQQGAGEDRDGDEERHLG